MARRLPFTKQDVTRAVSGAIAAGIEVQRVEIDPNDGKIILVIGKTPTPEEELDKEMAELEARAQQRTRLRSKSD